MDLLLGSKLNSHLMIFSYLKSNYELTMQLEWQLVELPAGEKQTNKAVLRIRWTFSYDVYIRTCILKNDLHG